MAPWRPACSRLQIPLAVLSAALLALVLPSYPEFCLGSQANGLPYQNSTNGVGSVQLGKDGRLTVDRTGGLFEAFDRSGAKMWSVNLSSDQFSVYDSAVTNEDDVLVVGILSELLELALYRISHDGRSIRRLQNYPNMVIADVSVAPDGAAYLLGCTNVTLQLMAASKINAPRLNQTAAVEEPVLHRLNENGEIVHSSHPIQIPAESWQAANKFLIDLQSDELYFSPSGRAYALNRQEPFLRVLDSDSPGERALTEKVPLFLEPPGERILISSFAFLTDEIVAFSVSFADASGPIVGSEVRVQNLITGHYRTLFTGPENTMSAKLSVDRHSKTLAVYSSIEILEGHPTAVWVSDFRTLVQGLMR